MAGKAKGKRCPHCRKNKSQPDRRGGLCWTCSLTPEIRDQYERRPTAPKGLDAGERRRRNHTMAHLYRRLGSSPAVAEVLGNISGEAVRFTLRRMGLVMTGTGRTKRG